MSDTEIDAERNLNLDEVMETPLIADSNLGNRSEAVDVWQGIGQDLSSGNSRIPVDQSQTIATLSQIEDANRLLEGSGSFLIVDTGIFNALNADSVKEAEGSIQQSRQNFPEKKEYFETLMDRGNFEANFVNAESYWMNEEFWDHIDYLIGSEYGFEDLIKINQRTDVNGDLTAKEFSGLMNRFGIDTPKIDSLAESYRDELGRDLKASQLYFLAELGMGAFLTDSEGIDVKLGQRGELRYDRHGEPDHIHMRQPVALNSSAANPVLVDPYIDGGERIYAGDSREEVRQKVNSASVDHVVTDSEKGSVMNGLVGLTAYAVEISDQPLVMDGETLSDTEDVLQYARDNHPQHYSAESVADFIYENLTFRN